MNKLLLKLITALTYNIDTDPLFCTKLIKNQRTRQITAADFQNALAFKAGMFKSLFQKGLSDYSRF